MNAPKGQNKGKIKGLSTAKMVVPIAVILVVMHSIVVGTIFMTNRATSELSETMNVYFEYISDATDLQAGTSMLSETSMSFVLNPVLGPGVPNIGPLSAFCGEIRENARRGDDVMARFEKHNLNEKYKLEAELMRKLDIACESANSLVQLQAQAIRLVLDVYPAPPTSSLEGLPTYNLTEEERALPAQEKQEKAIAILTSAEYSRCKQAINENITFCNNFFRREMQAKSDAQLAEIRVTRVMLWVVTFSVIGILVITFGLMIRMLVTPLRTFVRRVDEGDSARENRGLVEVKLLARSYNELLAKKDSYEKALRSVAETDALTNLPNRYFFEQYMLKTEEEDVSVALFLFDVNYLKVTNDKDGHLAGDALLQRTAKCLSTCFEKFGECKCFRIGGDEFATIVKNCSREDIDEALALLYEEQEKNGVNLSVGYVYTDSAKSSSMWELFNEADRRMYENKKEIHAGSDR